MGICTKRLDGIDAVIDEVPPAGHRDPRIAGGNHVRTGVSGKDEHRQPAYYHGPAGKGTASRRCEGVPPLCPEVIPTSVFRRQSTRGGLAVSFPALY